MSKFHTPTYIAYSPSADNLRSLLIIRSIALLGQTAVLGYVLYNHRGTENPSGLAIALSAMAIITVISLWRANRGWPVTDQEFLCQLLVDVIGWSCLMYVSGGANNPFISYYIVPLVVSAAVLPWRYTWLLAGSSLFAYSMLLYNYQPFPLFTPNLHAGHGSNMHVLGMWFNFLFSAGLITYFVVRMATVLRRQEAEAVARREDSLRDDQIMAVASLAAGTAHELGTPLSTISVLLEDILEDTSLPVETRDDCLLMQKQLLLCREILRGLSDTAQLTSAHETQSCLLEEWVKHIVSRWAVRRPQVKYTLDFTGETPSPKLQVDPTLAQAVENLLNNAANTGTDRLEISANWNTNSVTLAVRDYGPGVPAELLQRIGKPVVQASESGLGLGLLLSHATVERYGGHIELRNAEGTGTIATLTLPLNKGETNHDR